MNYEKFNRKRVEKGRKISTLLEITIEVAHQLPDNEGYGMSRAEYFHKIEAIVMDIIEAGIIHTESEDIDEIIHNYLKERGLKA